MSIVPDILMLVAIATVCWRGYQYRAVWFELPLWLYLQCGRGRGLWVQLVMYGLPVVLWLLLCHWVNTHGWHASAAGGMLIAMSYGLAAMRMAEEEQKWLREQCDAEL